MNGPGMTAIHAQRTGSALWLRLGLAFGLVWVALMAALVNHRREQEQAQFTKNQAVLQTTYQASVEMHALNSATIFQQAILQPAVLELFALGVNGQGEATSTARGALYRTLTPLYDSLRKQDIQQLQFHTAEGESFLNFLNPQQVGSFDSDRRPLVRLVQRERQAVSGFEIGRSIAAFRFVHPIEHQGQHLGSVETGVTFRFIRDAMSRIDNSREYNFVLRRDTIDRALASDLRGTYVRWAGNSDYVSHDTTLNLPDAPPALSQQAQLIERSLQAHTGLRSAMAEGQAFSLVSDATGDPWSITLLPVRDLTGTAVAYIVAFDEEPVFATLRRDFYIAAVSLTVVLAALALLAHRILHAGAQLRQQKKQLSVITETIADGLYVMDDHGIVTMVNQAFTDLLGYRRDEVLGHIGHDLFHVHESHESHETLPLHECPIYTAVRGGGSYAGEQVFLTRDGRHLTVEVSSRPLCDEWGQRLGGSVTAFRDVTERRRAQAEIQHLAFHDQLTGLPNRRLLHERLAETQVRSAQHGTHAALLFIDLDHFKSLNDTRGHEIGDRLLEAVAHRLTRTARPGDLVARLGGDEFVVMLEGLDPSPMQAATQARMVAERLREALTQPYTLASEAGPVEHPMTASLGVGLFRGQSESAHDLLKHADLAMYEAKSAGRNAVRFFDPIMQETLNRQVGLLTDLRQALAMGQFDLAYQALIGPGEKVQGVELLLRWNHPTLGPIAPSEFIALAEDSGLIVPIGAWVLRNACRQIRDWSTSDRTRHLSVAVNVSALQFRHPDFVDLVRECLLETGADPERLKLELTESVVIHDFPATVEKMNLLRRLGVRFSLDDFGTGYSSLSYLKRLPLSQLKIDRSFVQDLQDDPSDAIIVRTIIGMGHSLGLDVVAEGVETQAQQGFLQQHGCRSFQGYLFARPVPRAEFERTLQMAELSTEPASA